MSSKETNVKDNYSDDSLMNKVWFRTLISLLGFVYTAFLAYSDYAAFFYTSEYADRTKFAIVGAIFCALVCFLQFFTRRTFFTALLGMINVVLLFPLLMLDWGNWPLIIPMALVTLFGFFVCHMNETAKTIFGTIFLLLYIIGGVAFYLVMNVFQVTTVDTLIDEGISSSGMFRYYVLDVQNKASGKVAVYVQPAKLDKQGAIINLRTTIKKMVKQANKPVQIECHWDGENLLVNGEVYFTESEYAFADSEGNVVYDIENKNWSYTYFNFDYPLLNTINSIKNKVEEHISEKKEDRKSESKEKTDEILGSDDSESSEEDEMQRKKDRIDGVDVIEGQTTESDMAAIEEMLAE